jgi:hypothetical protein
MFLIELGAPFLIFAPRRIRFLGFFPLVVLQVLILLTGNYCFFNLLTMVLCLTLLDDTGLRRLLLRRSHRQTSTAEACESGSELPPASAGGRRSDWPIGLTAPVAAFIVLVSIVPLAGMLRIWTTPPGWARGLESLSSPFRTINSYGLFAVMTTERLEITVEGSNDHHRWLPYTFKYKPGDVNRRPGFVEPLQPRLDWQMWFAALGTYRDNPWFVSFCVRLLRGSPEVLALLEKNPFPSAPPRYLRAVVDEYHFTNLAERRATGAWWKREPKGEYLPEISLRE